MKFIYFVKKEVVIIEIWFLKNEAPQIWNFLSNLQKLKTVSKVDTVFHSLRFEVIIFNHLDTINGDSSDWFIFFIFFCFGNFIYNIHALDNLTKDRVFSIKTRISTSL